MAFFQYCPCGRKLPSRAAACDPTVSLSFLLYQHNEDDGVRQFQKEQQDSLGDYETIDSTRENGLSCMKN